MSQPTHPVSRFVIAWWPGLLLAIASMWVVSPMYDVDWWGSHESYWYPVRVHEYLESWRAGVWYPRWCPNLYGGYGYPFLHYYAPGVYFSGALTSQVGGVGPLLGLKIVMTVMTAASAVGAYGWMRSETRRIDAAFLGAACFVFLPYRCTDLFARGDLAEYAAYCLIPFVAWSYRAITWSSGRRTVLATTAAALMHAGVLLTHTLMGMLTTELVGLYVLVLLVRRRRRAATLAITALVFAIALAAIYVVPAFFERKLVLLERVTQAGYTPWQNPVSFDLFVNPFFTPGWPFLVGGSLWLVSFAIPRARSAAVRAAIPWAIAVALAVLMLPHVVSIWKLLPFGAEVQFPWRLLGFIGLFSALGIAMWWAELLPASLSTNVAVLVLALALTQLLAAQRQVAPIGPVPLSSEVLRSQIASSTVMDEYLPRHVLAPPLEPRTRLAWPTEPGVGVLARELDGLHYELEISAPGPAVVAVGVFGFRGWHLRTLEGPARARLRIQQGNGLLHVHVPEAGRYRVLLYFGQTPLRIAATCLSVLALLTLLPVVWLVARRERADA